MICSAQSCCKGDKAKLKIAPYVHDGIDYPCSQCPTELCRICLHSSLVCSEMQENAGSKYDTLVTEFIISLGVSGRLKQMVPSLLPSHPALHLCHLQSRKTGSSPTPLMCSSHHQALCQGATLTCPVSGSHLASWVGCERCLEGLGHSFVLASSKRLMM